MNKNFFVSRVDGVEFEMDVWGTGVIINTRTNDNAVSYVAIQCENVIGALSINKKKRKNSRRVDSIGTGVRPTWHNIGVGKALWNAMIKHEKPKEIHVRTVSNKGYSLIESLKERHPKIKWLWNRDCCKSLRRKNGNQNNR